MRLYTFWHDGRSRIGAEWKGVLVDLCAAYELLRSSKPKQESPAKLPSAMIAFLAGGKVLRELADETLGFVGRRPAVPVGERIWFQFEEVKILPPIPRPGKILCSGINYRSHMEENPGAKLPESPFFFSKLPTAVIGQGEPIVSPRATSQLDYEVELAVVIGRKMKRTPEPEIFEHLAGYTILHDVSARDVQFKDNQITLGKNFDSFCPLGPCIVTTEEMPDPSQLGLRSYVNGTLMQNGNTRDWVFPLPRLLHALSNVMTLEPGDIVSTGTPAGVGVFRKPPVFLKPGDTVRLEIDGIGVLENPVVGEE